MITDTRSAHRPSGLRQLLPQIKKHYAILFHYRALIHFIVVGQSKSDLFKTVLGEAWFVIEPLMRMAIYYFLLIVVFNGRASYGVDPFLLIMFGLTHYLLFQQSVTTASTTLLDNELILMQLNIEPMVFIAISFLKTLKNFMFSLGLYYLFHLIISPSFTFTILAYPFLLGILAILSWSFSIILASLTVFFRDFKQLISIILYVLMYFSPVIYTADFFPARVRELLLYNPIGCLFSLLHWSAFGLAPPSVGNIIVMMIFTLFAFVFAHRTYRNRRAKFTKAF